MSNASARPNSPTESTSASKSRPEPGLPCTNTTASLASAGPASLSSVPIPPTTILRARGASAGHRGGGLGGGGIRRAGPGGAHAGSHRARKGTKREQLARRDPALPVELHAAGDEAV